MSSNQSLPLKPTIGIIGLGYVGLPLAVEFGKNYQTLGFDILKSRITELQNGADSTLEVETELLADAIHLTYTCNVDDIIACDVCIVTKKNMLPLQPGDVPYTYANTDDL